jgi:hypothetical protein
MSRMNSQRLRLVAVVMSLLVVALVQFVSAGPSSADTVPYRDPSAVGSLTLCDTSGHELTSGTTGFAPFAWRIIGSTPAQAPYNGPGRTATLFAYQPMQNVDPSNWFGQALTGSARYTDAAHPMAAATPADLSLDNYLVAYPTKWDDLVQLRLFVGAPNRPTYFSTYDAATLKVTGKSWTLVQGGGGSCASGTAVSNEMVLPSVASMPTPHSYPSAAVPATHSSSGSTASKASKSAKSSTSSNRSAATTGSNSGADGSSTPSVDGSPVSNESASSGSSGTPLGLIAGIFLAVLIVGGGGTWFWMRRRSVSGG